VTVAFKSVAANNAAQIRVGLLSIFGDALLTGHSHVPTPLLTSFAGL